MAIRYEMTPVALFGQLGRLAGQAQAAREQQQQIAQQASQIRQMQHQTAMAEFQAKLDLQAEMRARQWELQKAEINSQYNLQEQLRTESMLRDRDIRKRMEREENAEKALKELSRLWGDKNLLTPANRAIYDNIESKITAEKYGFDISVPMPPKAAPEKQLFTGAKIQQTLGALMTRAPVSAFGIPLPMLTKKEDREAFVINELGPNWKQIAPEAIPLVEGEEYVPPIRPAEIPADAFYENGTWKIIRNGQKMKWIE